MSLVGRIQRALSDAFNQLGDLAKPLTFERLTDSAVTPGVGVTETVTEFTLPHCVVGTFTQQELERYEGIVATDVKVVALIVGQKQDEMPEVDDTLPGYRVVMAVRDPTQSVVTLALRPTGV